MSFASSLRLAAPLVLLTPLLADADWQSGGPEAGSITALAVDPSTPSTLYAGAGCGGVYKTVNGAVLRRTCWCESRPFTEKMDQVRQQAESRMLRRARLPRVLRCFEKPYGLTGTFSGTMSGNEAFERQG